MATVVRKPIPQNPALQPTGPQGSISIVSAKTLSTPSDVLGPGADRSQLFWCHEKDQLGIRQVVIMLGLISVYLVIITQSTYYKHLRTCVPADFPLYKHCIEVCISG